MTVEQLKTAYRAQPFRPFTIHRVDGRSFFIKHRDFISQSPAGRMVIVYGDGEDFSILDFLLMTALQMQSSGQPGAAA